MFDILKDGSDMKVLSNLEDKMEEISLSDKEIDNLREEYKKLEKRLWLEQGKNLTCLHGLLEKDYPSFSVRVEIVGTHDVEWPYYCHHPILMPMNRYIDGVYLEDITETSAILCLMLDCVSVQSGKVVVQYGTSQIKILNSRQTFPIDYVEFIKLMKMDRKLCDGLIIHR